MSARTDTEARAYRFCKALVGREVLATEAALSNDSDVNVTPLNHPAVRLKVTMFDGSLDVLTHEGDGLVDTIVWVEPADRAARRRLEPGWHFCWVDGPTFHFDGRIDWPKPQVWPAPPLTIRQRIARFIRKDRP